MEYLKQEQEEVREKTWDLYDLKDDAREKFLAMDNHLERKREELWAVELQLKEAKHELNPDRFRQDFEFVCELFPTMTEIVRIVRECISMGFSQAQTRQIASGKTVQFTGELYSEEHKQSFKADNITAKIEPDLTLKNRFHLAINGISIAEWFLNLARQVERVGRKITPPQPKKGRGVG